MKNKIYIHIGLGKTATTWFQEKLFSKCEEINYLGKTETYYPEWLIKLHYADDYVFEKEKNRIQNLIFKKISNNNINLLSSESFTNPDNVFSQGYRIKELFPNAKIILFLRNPIDFIKSFYKFNVKQGVFWKKLEEYLDFKEIPFALQKRKQIFLKGLWYDEIINYYQELFGKNNLCVLKYENFNTNPQDFVNEFGNFMEINFGNIEKIAEQKVLKGPKAKELKYLKKKNFKKNVLKNLPNSEITINEKDFDNEVMTVELENRLKEYFYDKCWMYKEELATKTRRPEEN